MLDNAYLALHLEADSEKTLLSILWDFRKEGLVSSKKPHVTLDYLWRMSADMLNNLAFGTRIMLLLSGRGSDAPPVTLGMPSHFVSDKTKEDIFYLPAQSSVGLFKNLRSQWYSVTSPHLTLLKGQELTNTQIETTLQKLNQVIFPEKLSVNTQEVFCHGTEAE